MSQPIDFVAYSQALTKTQKAIQDAKYYADAASRASTDALAGLADINRIVGASLLPTPPPAP